MREFQSTKVIPEIDAYRYSKIYELAEAAGKTVSYTPAADTVFEKLMNDITAVRDAVGECTEIVVAMSAKAAGMLDLAKGGTNVLQSGFFEQG